MNRSGVPDRRRARYRRAGVIGCSLLLIGLPALTGCGETKGEEPPLSVTAALGQQFTLAPGATGHIDDDRIRVTFHEVRDDSRCPTDVQCVWAGDAIVVVSAATGGGDAARYELHSNGGPDRPRTVRVADYEIELIDLTPRPISTGQIAKDDYRASLVVDRL
ncbi:hypothetical protein ACFXNW_23815 [Nocardia sp. NPDC059180]|uniref:hypothetical protein n=1 Tax=Nocardia sp. NPDC059180 TaxID=3346761 RepID=UPI00368945BF